LESRGPLKLTMNTESVAVAVAEVKEKTQAFALCAPSFESSLNSAVTAGITAGRQPSFAQRELSSAGWVWLGNEVLSIVERLPKKCRPSVRSVLLAYAQLSSRRGNARTFPAAASLVARIACCSVSTVHVADNYLKAAGIITVRKQRHSTGHDAPRLVSLCEVEAAPPEVFEIVPVDHLPAVRKYRSRQSKNLSDTGVRVAHSKSDTLKKHSKEIINRVSLSKDDEPRCEGIGEREVGDSRNEAMARKHGLTVAEVEKHRREHESNMAAGRRAGRVKGFATEASLDRYIASLPSQTKSAPTTDKTAARVTEAVALRARWWQQFAASTANVPSSWNGADDDTRKKFMMDSKEGATFLALALSLSWDGAYFEVDEETGAVAAK